jgi:hypothetical protein
MMRMAGDLRPSMATKPGQIKPLVDSDRPLKLAEESLTWREVDGEIVVLDRRSWMYMGVNGSGVLLWKQLVEGASRPQLVKCLCDAYEIDAEEAQRGVESFLEMLRSHDLLVEDDAG